MSNDHRVSESATTGAYPAAPSLDATRDASRKEPWTDDAAPAVLRTHPGGLRLGRGAAEVIFELVVATMWSDGELTTSEVERGRAAAEALGIRPRGGGAFAAIAQGALPFSELAFARLGPTERHVAYAACAWLDAANETSSERRAGFLRALQTRLEISSGQAEHLQQLATTIGQEPDRRHGFVALGRAVVEETAVRQSMD